MQENDETGLYDHQLVLSNEQPYLPLAYLLVQLGNLIHPQTNYLGEELPAWNSEEDVKSGDRDKYISYLKSKLIEAINRGEIIIKDSYERIVEHPAAEEDLKNAIIYKSQIPKFTRLVRIKTVFKPLEEMVVETDYEGERRISFKRFDKYIFDETESTSESSRPGSLEHDRSRLIYDHGQIEEGQAKESDSSEKCRADDAKSGETVEPKLVDDAQVEQAANSIAPDDEKVEDVDRLHLAADVKDREVDDSTAVDDKKKVAELDRSRLANWKELAGAFKVKNNEDENNQWFNERCSNPTRYKAFLDARTVPGSKKPGGAALFDVLAITAILLSDKKRNDSANTKYFRPPNYSRYLRRQVESNFPQLLDEFDTHFGTSG